MATQTISETERNAEAIHAYLEGHDTSRLAADAVFTDAATGMSWQGPEAIEGMIHWFYQEVFDAHTEDERLVIDRDGAGAVLEATFVGIHRGEFAGVAATGREVRIPLVVVYDLADGKVAGARIHFGAAAFLAQVRSGR